MSRGGCLRLE
eukprot:gene27127-biopygen17678